MVFTTRKLLFARETTTENQNESKGYCEPQSQQIDLQSIPSPNAQGTLQNRRQDDYKSQRSKEFAEQQTLLVTSEATHKVSPK